MSTFDDVSSFTLVRTDVMLYRPNMYYYYHYYLFIIFTFLASRRSLLHPPPYHLLPFQCTVCVAGDMLVICCWSGTGTHVNETYSDPNSNVFAAGPLPYPPCSHLGTTRPATELPCALLSTFCSPPACSTPYSLHLHIISALRPWTFSAHSLTTIVIPVTVDPTAMG